MPENRKLRVFLCHASQDKPIVRELYQRLFAEDWIDPWLDEEKLLPGQDWDIEIEKTVESTDAVIVCLSNNSVSKEGYIQKEIKKVLDISDQKPEGTIFIIPLRLDDCEPPRRLAKWHYENYFPIDLRDKSFQRILRALVKRHNGVSGKTVKPALKKVSSKTTPKFILSVTGIFVILGVLIFLSPYENKIFSSANLTSPQSSFAVSTGNNSAIEFTATSTSAVTPALFPLGVYSTPGSFEYYFDPSLTISLGVWSDSFYVCDGFINFSVGYDSYRIAKKPEDCLNGEELGWIQYDAVNIKDGQVVESRITLVSADAKQCQDGIDNDYDNLIDFPSDAGCSNINDDREDISESMRVSIPSQLICPLGQNCSVKVTIRIASSANICVYVQSQETQGQPYYFQFQGSSGNAGIGPAPDSTPFVIFAVATSSCPKGQQKSLLAGDSASATIIRINQ